MPNNEELAQYVASVQEESVAQERAKGQGYMLPKPPAPGEYIYCQICGKKMMPEDFSKDPKIRKQEFKWHIHNACKEFQLEQCDLQTPGLLAERKNGLRIGRRIPNI